MSKEHQIFGQCKDCTWVVVPKKWFIFYPENWGNDPNWTIAYFSNGLVKNHQFEQPGYIPCRISIQCCRNPAFRMRQLSRMVQPSTRYILRKTWCRWGLSLGCFRLGDGSGMSSAFSGCWSCRRGKRFFSGAAGGWEGSHFLLCVNHQELGFSKFVFFWGEDEFKETRKRCWILKF